MTAPADCPHCCPTGWSPNIDQVPDETCPEHGRVVVEQHATCQHAAYRISCAEYDALVERSGSACELCDRDDVRLWIDHAHTTGLAYGPVRGLLCPKCNAHMRRVDSGERVPNDRALAYMSRVTT